MKTIVIPQPIANDILLGQQQLVALPFNCEPTMTQFLMVSDVVPMADEYTLGLALGYQLGIVTVNEVVPSEDLPGLFEWDLSPKALVKPVQMQLPVDEISEIADEIVTIDDAATEDLMTWLADQTRAFGAALTNHADTLLQIGVAQMPREYQEILAETNSWEDVDEAWLANQQAHHADHHHD